MLKGLIIVESPAKANTISKFLHNQYVVKASYGHIRDLPKSSLGIDVDKDFQPKYILDKSKTKVLSELKEAISKVDAVFLASDNDREGEAIAWHVSQAFAKELKGKKVQRIVFNEITSKAIVKAIEEPGSIDIAKVDAQQARRVLDRLVGYTVSPLLWKVIEKGLSAGRVQSVALRLICEREQEVRVFVPREYWQLEADFWRGKLPKFHAVMERWNGEKLEIGDEAKASMLIGELKDQKAVLQELKRAPRKMEPYPPFITSTLQQEASKILNFQSSRTMIIAQQLYEGISLGGEHTGLITYMRTDSLRIADEAVDNCRSLIKDRFGKDLLNSSVRKYQNKSTAQDAHEAIRPTDAFRTPEAVEAYLSKEQLKLYTLIWQRFIATQMKPAQLQVNTAKVSLGPALFSASGTEILEEGFIKAYPHVVVVQGEKIHEAYVQEDLLEYDKLEQLQYFTKPPSRFTEASLIKELEAKGIGRPSTYASIIDTIKKRKYVQMEKKSFLPTSLGDDVNGFLVGKFDSLFNVRFTAEMETELDGVEEARVTWPNLVKGYYDQLKDLIGDVDIKKEKGSFTQETDIVCNVCKEGKMMIKRSRGGEFLACSRYPECKNSKSFKRDKDGNIVILEPTLLEEKCPLCGSNLLRRNGRYGEFTACSTYPKCKYVKPNTIGVKCPDCGKGEVVARKSKAGKQFYSCSTYPECKWITNDKPVPTPCPSCNNPFMYEKTNKTDGLHLFCPKCKTKLKS
ncbi:MAG: type I DNA topoisomerase [Candidatus Cloacimonadota bacterium]